MTSNTPDTTEIEGETAEGSTYETVETNVEESVERDVIETPMSHPDDAAPAAKFITPGAHSVESQVTAIRKEMSAERADLDARLAEIDTGPDMSAVNEAVTAQLAPVTERLEALEPLAGRLDSIEGLVTSAREDMSGQLEQIRGEIAASDTSGLVGRLTELETKVEGTAAEVASMSQSLSEAALGGSSASEDTLARLAANASLLEGFRGEIGEIAAQTGELAIQSGQLTDRVNAVEEMASRQIEEAAMRAEDAEAQAQASTAQAEAAIAEAEAESSQKLAAALEAADRLAVEKLWNERYGAVKAAAFGGFAFESELDSLDQLGMTEVPSELFDAAASGISSSAKLKADFIPLSHAAIKTDTRNVAEDSGVAGRVGAFFRSQVSTRTLDVDAEGDGTAAILSRIDAAVDEDDMGAVISQADSLSEAARGVLADWLTQVEQRNSVITTINSLGADAS